VNGDKLLPHCLQTLTKAGRGHVVRRGRVQKRKNGELISTLWKVGGKMPIGREGAFLYVCTQVDNLEKESKQGTSPVENNRRE